MPWKKRRQDGGARLLAGREGTARAQRVNAYERSLLTCSASSPRNRMVVSPRPVVFLVDVLDRRYVIASQYGLGSVIDDTIAIEGSAFTLHAHTYYYGGTSITLRFSRMPCIAEHSDEILRHLNLSEPEDGTCALANFQVL